MQSMNVMPFILIAGAICLLALIKSLFLAVKFGGLYGFLGWVALMFFPPLG